MKGFRQSFKNEGRHYLMYLPDDTEREQLNRQRFRQIHDRRWQIESFHWTIEQVCNIERFQRLFVPVIRQFTLENFFPSKTQ